MTDINLPHVRFMDQFENPRTMPNKSLSDAIDVQLKMQCKIERLRAALEQIANTPDKPAAALQVHELRTIAREALK